MTRIIGGLLGSRRLTGPAMATRPTSDRIRESLFSALEAKGAISNASVLDLYAGTGALAVEALSRGALSAVLVENNKAAAAVCQENSKLASDSLSSQGHPVTIEVLQKPVAKFLANCESQFSLVFIDPPYEIENQMVEEDLENLSSCLSLDAWVILERSARSPRPSLALEIVEEKNYGDTTIFFLRQH